MKFIKYIMLLGLVGIQLWMGFINFRYPALGINIELTHGNKWVVSDFQDIDSYIQLGMQVGDVIISIDGKSPETNSNVRSRGLISLADEIVFSREGTQFEVRTKQVVNNAKYNLYPFLSEIICLFLAALIYKKVNQSPSARMLALVFLNFTIIFMSVGASSRGDAFGKLVVAASMSTLPIIFLHFFRVFLYEKGNIPYSKFFMKSLYLIPISISIMATSILSPSLEPSTYLIIKGGNILSFTLGIILILVVLGHCYWKYRKQNSFFTMVIKTSFFALIFSFTPFITLSFLPQLFTKNLPVNPYYTGWFILLFPLSFTYLILAKRLYDIDVIVRRILFTMVIAIVPSVLLTLIYTILFRTEAAILTNVTVFLAALGVVTCILYSLEYLTNKFEPLMFPRKHNLKQAFKKMADKMSGIQSFQEIKEILLVDIHKTLEVEGVAIVLQFPDRMEVIVEGELDSEKIQKQLAFGGLDQEQFTVFPISRHEEYESRLIFTKKKNNTHLNKEEIDWLAPVLSNLAVSLENVYLIQKLTMRLHQLAGQIPNNGNTDDLLWLRKAMFEIQEKERYRIAIDIHDSTMQDIFLLKNRVDLLADRSSIPKEEKKELQSYVNHLEIINQNLRNNCFELNPHLLKEIGLVHTLDKWMESEVNEFEIEYTASFRELIESVDLDMKKHLFRISQELINNARKHSQATMVRLKLTVLDDQIWLTYKDNGKGFDMKRLSISERLKVHGNSGLGMEQLKSRVWLLKGRIRIYSKPGRGVRVHVRVPIDLNRLRIVQ